MDFAPNLGGLSYDEGVRQIAKKLHRAGQACAAIYGSVLIEEHFAREVLDARIYGNLRYKEDWCCYKASYRGVEDHYWLYTWPEDSPGAVWTIDVHLQRRLQCYDNHLIPNGLFYPFAHPENRKRFRRYGVQVLALSGSIV